MKTAQLICHSDRVSEIERFKRFPPHAMDHENNPIFEVPFPVILPLIASRELILDMLMDYGLELLSPTELLTGVADDLMKQDSRMKSPKTSEKWHTAAANLLLFLLRSSGADSLHKIREMELIPLVNGTWGKTADLVSPLCFASINGLAIPEDLPLTLISPLATKNAARAALFRELGAKEFSISDIRKLIFDRYPASEVLDPILRDIGLTEDISIGYLKFLYLTHKLGILDTKNYRRLVIFTETSTLKRPALDDVYLFNHANDYRSNQYYMLAASLEIDCISTCYHADDWQLEYAWLSWLRTVIGIRAHLKLMDDNGPTSILQQLMSLRSDKFLGILHYHWSEIRSVIKKYPSLVAEIANTLVPCGGRLVELSNTYLPFPKLVISSYAFLEIPSSFPFLDLSNTLAPTDLSAWDFLSEYFGVSDSRSEIFYLDILQTIARDDYEGKYGEAAPARAFGLYEIIYKEIGVTAVNKERREYLRLVLVLTKMTQKLT